MNREGKEREFHEDVDVRALSRTKALLYHHLEHNSNSRLIGKIYLDLGQIYQRIRNYPLAHEAWDKATGYFADVRETVQLASAHFQQGMLFLQEHEGEKAKEKLHLVLEVLADFEEDGYQLKAEASYQLGNYLLREGELERAKPYLENGIILARRGGNLKIEILAMQALARVSKGGQNPNLALKIYHNSLNRCQRLGDQQILGSIINDLGYIYLERNDFKRALTAFRYSADVARKHSDSELHNILIQLGKMYSQINLEAMRSYCQEAIDLLLGEFTFRFNEKQEKRLAEAFELMIVYCREKNDRKNMLIFMRQCLEIYKKYRMETEWLNIHHIYIKYAPTDEVMQYSEDWELVKGLPQHEKLRVHKFIG